MTANLGKSTLKAFVKKGTVRETRDRIVKGEVLGLRLACLELNGTAPHAKHQQRHDQTHYE
jgi:hypothetical protein